MPTPDPDLRLTNAGPDAPPGTGVLVVAARRWPLLVVGLAVGLVGGVFLYLQKAKVYQSSAQVLVIKKRPEAAVDIRAAYVEDHIATQLTLLKSERILLAAARRLGPASPDGGGPDADRGRAGMLAGGLAVARDAAAGPSANGVVVLSFRAGSPETSRAYLEAVIQAYQAELLSLYDAATLYQMQFADQAARDLENVNRGLDARRKDLADELRRITEEDLVTVRARLSDMIGQDLRLVGEQFELGKQLEVIAAAGRNPQKRLAALAQLAALPRGAAGLDRPDAPAGGPMLNLRLLQSRRQELGERLGRDHPDMRTLDTQIAFYQGAAAGAGVAGPGGEPGDELWVLGQRLGHQKAAVDEQLVRVRGRISRDREVLAAGGRPQDQLARLEAQIALHEKQIDNHRQERRRLELTREMGGYEAQVITEPAPGRQIAPVLGQSVLLGAVLGLALGGGLGYLAEVLDQSFRSPADVRARLGLAVIGHLPQFRPDAGGPPADGLDASLVTVHRPKSPEAEAYRGVRTQLYFSTRGKGHQVVQVTSPTPGDGKSTLAANLAVSAAQTGKRTVLVDCDFRKPRVHKLFGLGQPDYGLAAVAAGEVGLAVATIRSVVPNLDLVPCGPRPGNPAELLSGPGFVAALDELRAAYDLVILDTPPVLAVSDPAVVAPRVDGVVLVVRMTSRARPAAERAREHLAAVGAVLIGVAVNGVATGQRDGYGSSYTYRYQYDYTDSYYDAGPDEPAD